MKRSLLLMVVLIMTILLASQVYGDADITTSGEVRVRCEYNNNTDKTFDKDDATVHQTLMRTRFNINAEINDNASAFIQLQDSRRFGDPQSGDTGDHGDVNLHQGYFTINQLWDGGIGVKIGRFEVKLGNQRVFTAAGWSNVGRAWDGTQFFFNSNNNKFKGYWLRPRDDFSQIENSDYDIFGLTADFNDYNLEVFGFYELDANKPVFGEDWKALGRMTFGLYYTRNCNQFDLILNGAYQMGKYAEAGFTEEADIAAYMFTFEAGYSFEGDMNPRLAAGVDLTSGDDDNNDNKLKAYNNLYYAGHKFRGFMDYFPVLNIEGLMDIMLRGKLNPVDGWTVKGDFHLFSSAVEYNAAGDKGIGSEFDLTVSTSNISGIKFDAGFSMFMPNEEYAGTDAETPIWFWMMGTVGF